MIIIYVIIEFHNLKECRKLHKISFFNFKFKVFKDILNILILYYLIHLLIKNLKKRWLLRNTYAYDYTIIESSLGWDKIV